MQTAVAVISREKLDEEPDYWAMATLGECALITGDLAEAGRCYRSAVEMAGSNFADVSSTRRNASILLKQMNEDMGLLERWFPIPKIALFTGHLIDLERP